MTKKLPEYLHRLPDSVPADKVLVHNHVDATRALGTRGFRAWLASGNSRNNHVCDCGWAPELGRHFMIPRPQEAACVGHLCDDCRTCRLGRCCKRDLPNYHMPEMGTWDGPVFGALGVLVHDGEHVRCHACGDWFRSLPRHVLAAHGIWSAEYKAYFGLNNSQGLVGGATSALLAASRLRLIAEGKLMSPADAFANVTTEQLREVASRPRRLQTRLDEKRGGVVRGAKISAALRGRPKAPEHIAKMREASLGKKASPETKAKMQAVWTPERRAAQGAKMRARSG